MSLVIVFAIGLAMGRFTGAIITDVLLEERDRRRIRRNGGKK